MGDLILIGLPASGKTTVGRQLAQRLDMPFFDCDEAIEAAAGCSVPDIFARRGEAYFRELEHQTLETLCRKEGCVIATGGGAVLRAQNVRALRQNGVVVYIDRPLGQLAVGGARPLSQSAEALAAMHAARAPLYAAACDARVENDGPFESVAEAIKERFYEILDH